MQPATKRLEASDQAGDARARQGFACPLRNPSLGKHNITADVEEGPGTRVVAYALDSTPFRPLFERVAMPSDGVLRLAIGREADEVVGNKIHDRLHTARGDDLRIRGTPGRIRTCDLPLRRRVLYPLSYWGVNARQCGYSLVTVRQPTSGTLSPKRKYIEPGAPRWGAGSSGPLR